MTEAHGSCGSSVESVHVIASIIALALIVAAVGEGDLILKLRLQSRLNISASLRSVLTVPSLPCQSQQYADGASSGPAYRFTITRSWLHRTRRNARRPWRGASGKLIRRRFRNCSAGPPVDCDTFRAAVTERLFRLPALLLQERGWFRPGRRSHLQVTELPRW